MAYFWTGRSDLCHGGFYYRSVRPAYVRGLGAVHPGANGLDSYGDPSGSGFLGFYSMGQFRAETVPLIFLFLWQTHYIYRAYVFPFKTRHSGKYMPVLVMLLAIIFNSLNAYINARWISHFGQYSMEWLTDPRFIIGVAVFFAGMYINRQSDNILINLRKPGESGHKIPKGGLYRFVSCPNYLGELMEWLGWAIATWSLAGLAFAIYTAANLAPRAVTNHKWYQEKFPDYPEKRRALIPFVI